MDEINFIDTSWSHYVKNKKNIVFTPSVSKQRYKAVLELLTHAKLEKHISSVTEYGCASFKFFPYLKNTPSIKDINFVDIDELLLETHASFIRPILYDILNKRANPLGVKIFEGSISDPDIRILETDAVVGIEVIEHLFPDTLEAVPYVVFHTIKPKVIIFTTPNADFNVALPKFKIFRHSDHKFEWSREQFESWASNITLRFPDYSMNIFGIGNGPKGTANLGHCSQLAIFVRKDILDSSYELTTLECICEEKTKNINEKNCTICYPMVPHGICTYLTESRQFKPAEGLDLYFYRLIESVLYPHKEEDTRTKEQHILDAFQNRIYNSVESVNEDGVLEIPFYTFRTMYKDELVPEEEVKNVLLQNGYEIKDCFVKNCNGEGNDDWTPCILYRRPETPSTESEASSERPAEYTSSAEEPLSDWDAENTTLKNENLEGN